MGLNINLEFDSAAQAAPASFRTALQTAASILDAAISDPITVNISIEYGENGIYSTSAEAGPTSGIYESYSTVRSALLAHAATGDANFNALPSGSSINGQSEVAVWAAQEKAFGQLPANGSEIDGVADFGTGISSSLLVGVALHELTHALGRVPYGPAPDIFDFFRYTSPGTRLFDGASTAPAAYFSVDGGYTKLADYGEYSDSSDFLNSGVQGYNDPFNEYYSSSSFQYLTAVDLAQLDVLGFNTITARTIESDGATSLVEFGSSYFLYASGTSSGPELQMNGTPALAGQFGTWSPIGAEAITGGYEVAWKDSATGQYTVWNTDSSGNFVADTIGIVSGTNPAFESLEVSFSQDLNGDGTIGLKPTATIESSGSTSLFQVGNNYAIAAVGSSTGIGLQYNGAPVSVGEFGSWAPIDVEQITGGYEVAWKSGSQFTVWNIDSNGNFVSDTLGIVSGTNAQLERLETSFSQDLNGDGTIGLKPTATIESSGTTDLLQVGSTYVLAAHGTTSGPELEMSGKAVTSGEFGAWTPIGAEAITGGYDVAWKNSATGQYTVWTTDSSGNYVSNALAAVSATDARLERLETSFSQDLNGDGTIGLKPTATIESSGATDLLQVGNTYVLAAHGTTSGPELEMSGKAVTSGEFGSWTPIGAEAITGGYDVAWKNSASGQYTVWTTDSSGNFVRDTLGLVSGTNAQLEVLESSFSQDLNGDGTIGLKPTATIESDGATSLLQVGNSYALAAVGSTTGVALQMGGQPVLAGQFGAWTPIGAEAAGSGYEVAWKNSATGQYTTWTTNASGNFVSDTLGLVSATNTQLEALEPSFQQDLNGDGVTGVDVLTGSTAELSSAYSGPVTFAGSTGTLLLDHSIDFSGTVAGMAGQDTFDLRDINFASVETPTYSGTTSSGTLSASDGTHTAKIALLGNYLASSFVTSSDGHGGTNVVDPLLTTVHDSNSLASSQHA